MEISEIIGYLAAACTTFAFVPQAYKIIKTKNTKDISLIMYIVFVFGIVCWLTFGLMTNSYPIIAANILSLVLSSSILYLKIRYK